MNRRNSKSARRQGRAGQGRSEAIGQLPWHQPRNLYEPFRVISDDELAFIHRKSLELLRDHGINFLLDEARDLLAAAGAETTPGDPRVRFDPDLLMDLVRSTPARFTLHARNPARNLEIGGNALSFTMVSSTPNVSDLEGGRRPGSLAAMRDLVRLSQMLNICHGCQGYPVEPVDVPVPIRHLEAGRALVTLGDKIMFAYGLGRRRLRDVHEINRIARGVDRDRFVREASTATTINCNSPLQYDTHLTAALIANARAGQVNIISPFTLAGAMSPVSLAGTLIQQNAEALAGIALVQAAHPGAPAIYGAFASNVDMKSGAPAFGTPEYAKTVIACGQLARFYGLPYRSSAPSTSNAADVQGAYETGTSLWACVLGGAHLVKHALGWQEGGLCSSFEKVIMDAEQAQSLAAFLKPMVFNEAEAALDAIAAVGPGGHFLGSPHTLERYETAFYAPMLSDWRNFENWKEAGAEDALIRANRIWKQLLADYEEPPMDPAIREELDDFVDRRIREGGADYGA